MFPGFFDDLWRPISGFECAELLVTVSLVVLCTEIL